jgi:hypothetical protein
MGTFASRLAAALLVIGAASRARADFTPASYAQLEGGIGRLSGGSGPASDIGVQYGARIGAQLTPQLAFELAFFGSQNQRGSNPSGLFVLGGGQLDVRVGVPIWEIYPFAYAGYGLMAVSLTSVPAGAATPSDQGVFMVPLGLGVEVSASSAVRLGARVHYTVVPGAPWSDFGLAGHHDVYGALLSVSLLTR